MGFVHMRLSSSLLVVWWLRPGAVGGWGQEANRKGLSGVRAGGWRAVLGAAK